MPKTPPEPQPLRVTVRDLVVTIPTVVALLTVAGLIGLPLSLSYRSGMEAAPEPPEQRWTAGTGTAASLATLAVRGALPAPDPRQKRAPCDDELAEEEIGGVCWQRLPVAKCNEMKAFSHNGNCYLRVMKVAPLPRDPTSGDGRPLGVADP